MSSYSFLNQDVNNATHSIQSLIEKASYCQDVPKSSDTGTLQNLQHLDGLPTRALSIVRQYLDTATPIGRCPSEILSEIFALSATRQLPSFCSGQDRVPFIIVKNLRLITLVCRLWRNVALSTPSLWCDVVFDRTWKKELSSRCLALAHGTPLRLHARGQWYGDEAMRMLRESGHCVREVYLQADDLGWSEIIDAIPACPPLLTRLTVNGGPRIYPNLRVLDDNGEAYFGGLAPALRHLSLDGVVCLPTDQFPNLTHFVVSGFGEYPMHVVLLVLSNMPRLQTLFFALGLEEGRGQDAIFRGVVELPHLRQLTAHNNCSDVVELLPKLRFPSACAIQFNYTTREELVSVATALSTPVPDFAQNLTRLRILPDPMLNGDEDAETSLYHLELLDDAGATRLSLGVYEESGLWTADARTAVTDALVEFFSSPAGAKLGSNIRELWVHNWTDLVNERLLAAISPIDTLGFVLARPPDAQTDSEIPAFIGQVTEAGIVRHCPSLTSLYVYACGADDIDRARAVAVARNDAGYPLRRLAIECMKDQDQPEAQSKALELGSLIHDISVTVQEKKQGWWKACIVPERWSSHGPCPWPERREWSSLCS